MFYHRRIDPSAYLVLWQVGVAGDRSVRRFSTGPAHRRLLVERLAEDYPMDHAVVLYEAATLPITTPRMDWMPMSELVDAGQGMQTTLVIPPAMKMQRNDEMLEKPSRLNDVYCRSEEHTSELQSLMRISYAVFCLKKK